MPSTGTARAKAPREESGEQYSGNHMPKLSENLVKLLQARAVGQRRTFTLGKMETLQGFEPKGDRTRLRLHPLTPAASEHQPKGGQNESMRLASKG